MVEQFEQKSPVIVRIFGQEYSIRATMGDAEYIKRVAQFVDERMTLLDEQAVNSTPMRLAILAALNIADELFTLQTEREQLLKTCEDKANQIAASLDEILMQT